MHREMRRKDRQVTDPTQIAQILEKARFLHLGLVDEGKVYVVPLNYGWTVQDGRYTLYAHSAREGRKVDLIAPGTHVGFALECDVEYYDGDKACDWSNRFQSIIGEGEACLVATVEEKCAGLDAIMRHYSKRRDYTYEEKMLNALQVIKIDVTALSAKIHE